MKIILSTDDLNDYIRRLLHQDGLLADGSLEWTWDEDTGPSVLVQITGSTAAAAQPTPPPPVVMPTPKKIETIKFPLIDAQKDAPMTKPTRPQGGNPPEEILAPKKKERKSKVKTEPKQPGKFNLNVTDRVLEYQEELDRISNTLIHPITGAKVKSSKKSSIGEDEFPEDMKVI